MATFLVDRELGGISMDDLAAAQRAAIDTTAAFRDAGEDVRYLHSVFEPSSGHCMCFFDAATATTVARVNDEAHLPYERVAEILDLTP
jgi:hypothetical protein